MGVSRPLRRTPKNGLTDNALSKSQRLPSKFLTTMIKPDDNRPKDGQIILVKDTTFYHKNILV